MTTYMQYLLQSPNVPSNTSNTGDSVSLGYPNNKKRVENMMHNRVFFHEIQGVWIADETLSRVRSKPRSTNYYNCQNIC